ncbi:MAG: transcription-repair coupling factor, partial [Woeseiaceae bacterium]
MLLPRSPSLAKQISSIGRAIGASAALAAVELAREAGRPLLVLAADPRQADQLEAEIRFFADRDLPVTHFVEWETLPYDSFSPHQDIVSDRLSVMASLPRAAHGVVIASAPSLLQRLPPTGYVAARSLHLRQGQRIERQEFIERLTASG